MTFIIQLNYKNVLGAEIRHPRPSLAKDIFTNARVPEPIWKPCHFDLEPGKWSWSQKRRNNCLVEKDFQILDLVTNLLCTQKHHVEKTVDSWVRPGTLPLMHNPWIPYDFHMHSLPGGAPCPSKLNEEHLSGALMFTLSQLAIAA